jgi:diguanylate cyclase (GGDEF)-like protein
MNTAGYLFLLYKRRRERRRQVQRELVESLQAARSEAEVETVLGRHLDRVVPGATVSRLDGNEPQVCLAIRLAKSHTRAGGREPLLGCDRCRSLTGPSTCVPLIARGEPFGSVLIENLEACALEDVHDAVARVAPVLANLRNLALAEARAETDAVTGLPNSRAVRGTLTRMIAQAGRTLTPLSVVLVDLDRFKHLNAVHGHERGDDVLTAVGGVLAATVRASDYAGRYGGEEFLVLLPDTDRDGAVVVAEKIRQAIARIRLTGFDALRASLGVASLPLEGADADALVRLADRALHAAKAAGGNRVEAAGLSVA